MIDRLRQGLLLALLALSWPTALRAQTVTLTYDLVEVWLLPSETHPSAPAQQMTGAFEWSYSVGGFESGVGRFVALEIPWWGSGLGGTPALDLAIQVDGIEMTMQGNYHDRGLDVMLRPVGVLSPVGVTPLDLAGSTFDIQVGISHRGHLSSGSLVPRCRTVESYGVASPGSGGFAPRLSHAGGEPRIGNAAFGLLGDRILGGAPCLLLTASDRAQLSFAGITLLVDPLRMFPSTHRASGAAGVPGVGAIGVPLPIPLDLLFVGVEFDLQFLTLDTGAPTGVLAASNGLAVVVCG